MSTENERSEGFKQSQSVDFGAVVSRTNDDEPGVERPVNASLFFMGIVEDSLNDE